MHAHDWEGLAGEGTGAEEDTAAPFAVWLDLPSGAERVAGARLEGEYPRTLN